jgi:hypothetical protein
MKVPATKRELKKFAYAVQDHLYGHTGYRYRSVNPTICFAGELALAYHGFPFPDNHHIRDSVVYVRWVPLADSIIQSGLRSFEVDNVELSFGPHQQGIKVTVGMPYEAFTCGGGFFATRQELYAQYLEKLSYLTNMTMTVGEIEARLWWLSSET